MLLKALQLPCPLTPVCAMSTVNFQLLEGHVICAVVGHGESHPVTEWTTVSLLLNAVNTVFAEVVATAAGEVRVAKHHQADGALGLEVVGRRLDELAIISPSASTTWLTCHFVALCCGAVSSSD